MSKKFKQLLSITLTLAMFFSMLVMPTMSYASTATLLAQNVAFTDIDTNGDEIGGDLAFEAATDETDITSYEVYFLESNGTKIGSAIMSVPLASAVSGSYTVAIPENTPITLDATQIGIFSKNAEGESESFAGVAINDDNSYIAPDTQAPIIESAVVGEISPIVVGVTFNEDIDITDSSGFNVSVNGVTVPILIMDKNTSNTIKLFLAIEVQAGDTVLLSYDDTQGCVTDTAVTPNSLVSFLDFQVTNNLVADTQAPTVEITLIDNVEPDVIEINLDEPVVFSDATGFSVLINDTPVTITGVTGNETSTIELKLGTVVQIGDIVKLSYDDTQGDVTDGATSPNELASFTDISVINNVSSNNPPVPMDKTLELTLGNGSAIFTIDQLATDLDNDTLSISGTFTASSIADTSVNTDGNSQTILEITPVGEGTTEIEVDITDGTDTVTVIILTTVSSETTSTDTVPSPKTNISFEVNTTKTINIAPNDIASDVDGDALSFVVVDPTIYNNSFFIVDSMTEQELTITGLAQGIEVIQVEVTDGTTSIMIGVQIEVTEVVNLYPTIEGNPQIDHISIGYEVTDEHGTYTEWVGMNDIRPGNALINVTAYDETHVYCLTKPLTLEVGDNYIDYSLSEFAEVVIDFDNGGDTTKYVEMLAVFSPDNMIDIALNGKTSVYLMSGLYYDMYLGIQSESLKYIYKTNIDFNTTLTGTKIIQADLNLTTTIIPDTINSTDFLWAEDVIEVTDTYGNKVTQFIEDFQNMTSFNTTVNLLDNGTIVSTQFIDNLGWANLEFNGLTGTYDIEIILPDDTVVTKSILLQDANSNTNELLDLNINQTGTNYIEFTTRGDVDYNTVDRMFIGIEGQIPNGLIYGDESGYIRDLMKNYNISLVEVTDTGEQEILVDKIYGQLRDVESPNNSNSNDNNLSILQLDLGKVGGFGLKSNTTYKIIIDEGIASEILTKVLQYIYEESEIPNVHINLVDTRGTEDGMDDDHIGYTGTVLTNPSVTVDTVPSVKEFKGSDIVTFVSDNNITLKLGDITGYTNLSKLTVQLEGTDTLIIPDITYSIDGINNVSANVDASINNDVNSYTIDIPITQQDLSTDFKIVLKPVDSTYVNDLQYSFGNYYWDSGRERGSVYVLGLDSTDNLVGFKKFLHTEDEILIDPTLEFKDLVQLPIVGRIDVDPDGNGWSTKDFDIDLNNTGITNLERLLVNGVTTSSNGTQIPFVLTFGDRGNGNYQADFYMPSHNSDHLDVIPDELINSSNPNYTTARQTYVTDSWENVQHYNQIPVVTGLKNTIQLEYYDISGVLQDTITFDYYPDARQDVFDYAQINEWGISQNTTEMIVEINEFKGSTDAMKLVLFTLDADNNETTVAEFCEVTNTMTEVENKVDDQGNTYTNNMTFVTFGLGTLGNNNLGSLPHDTTIYSKIVYNDQLSENPVISLDFEYYSWNELRLDTQPPEPHISFTSMENIDGTDYYKFAVRFGDDKVYLNTLSSANFVILDEKDGQNSGVSPDFIKGYRHPEDQRTESDPYNEIHLYYSTHQKDQWIKFVGIEDIAGNVMTTPKQDYMSIDTELKSFLRDANGVILTDKVLGLALVSDINYDTNNPTYPEIRHIDVDSSGSINNWLYPGQYKILWIADKEGYDMTSRESLDLVIDIPPIGHDFYYSQEIVLLQKNVTGKLLRTGDYQLKEKLAFIDSSQYTNYIDIINYEGIRDEAYDANRRTIEEYYIKTVETDEYGYFDLQLGNGTYKLLGKYLGEGVDNFEPSLTSYEFTINNDTATLTDIQFQEPNVFMTLIDHENNPVSHGYVEIQGTNWYKYVYTNADGYFGAYIQDSGTYRITRVESSWATKGNGKYYDLKSENISFDFDTTLANTNINTLQLPAPNSRIGLEIEGSPIPKEMDAHICIEEEVIDENGDSQRNGIAGVFTPTGIFDVYLPDGNYYISSIYYNDINDSEYNKLFTVSADSVANVKVDLANYYNAYIDIDSVDNTINKEGYRFVVFDEKDNWYGGYTNEAGRQYFNIDPSIFDADGLILIVEGYDYMGKWNRLNNPVTFIVYNDISSTNKYSTVVSIIPPNFRGSIIDDSGDVIMKDGWIDIENPEGERTGYHIGSDGVFEMSLDIPGTYIVKSAGNKDSWIEIEYKFQIVYENGNYVTKTLEGQTIPQPVSLTEVQPNLYGTLLDELGNLFASSQDKIELKIKEAGVPLEDYNRWPWLFEKWVTVDATTGYFETNVDDTKQYEAVAVSTWDEYYQFAQPVLLAFNSDNIVSPPAFSFNGSVKDFNDNNANEGGLWVVEKGLSDSSGTWIRINRNGSFGKNLINGHQYMIRDVSYTTAQDSNYKRLMLEKEVTIGVNSQSILIQPNIKGTITLGDLIDSSVTHMGLSIRPIYTIDDFGGDQTAFDKYKRYPWEYEMWMEMESDSNNSDANPENNKAHFYGYLKDGTYEVRGISIGNSYIDFKEEFTLAGTNSSTNIVNNGDKYELAIDYAPNVIGYVRENGVAVQDAWVNIEKFDNDWNVIENEGDCWYGANTDSDGKFTLKLSEGKYKVEGYHTKGQWSGTDWIEGKYVSVDLKFQVDAQGNVLSQDGTQTLTQLNLEPNFTANVFKLVDSSYQPFEDSWINICGRDADGNPVWEERYWGSTQPDNNQVTLMLPEGEYIVTETGGMNVWFKVSIPFDVDAEGIVTSTYLNGSTLEIKPDMPNLKGVAYLDPEKTQLLKWGWISIKPADAPEYDWSKAIYINTNGTGDFKGNIPDGTWNIVDIGNRSDWIRINKTFTVENDIISGLTLTNGYTTIAPPQPNVSGVVMDKNGVELKGKAWIAIKPVTADEHDWSNVIWAENKLIDETNDTWGIELYVEPGDYRVVEVSSYDIWYKSDITFTATNSHIEILNIAPPTKNFTGTVYEDINKTTLMTNGWINITRIDPSTGEQVKLNGDPIPVDEPKDEYTGIYWQYTYGTEIDNLGKFQMYVKDGEYKVVAVGSNSVWYQANIEFAVSGNNEVNLEITKPLPNVRLTIENVPSNLSTDIDESWLNVYRLIGEYKIFEEIELVSISGNTFVFEGTLNDDTYNVGYLGTPIGGIEIDESFTIVDNSILNEVTIDLGTEENVVVNGVLTINGSNVGEKVWIRIEDNPDNPTMTKTVKTDVEGNFTFILPKDTTWYVTEIGRTKGYKQLNSPLEYSTPIDFSSDTWNLDVIE